MSDELKALNRRAVALALALDFGAESATINTRILELDPTCLAAHTRLGRYLESNDNDKEAIAHYEAALKTDPANSVAKSRLERLLWFKKLAEGDGGKGKSHHGTASLEDVAAYFEWRYPDKADRRAALLPLVETIGAGVKANSASVGLTVHRDFFRLNVGRVGWTFAREDAVCLLAGKLVLVSVPEATRLRLKTEDWNLHYLHALPQHPVLGVVVPLDVLDDVRPLLWPSHLAIVRGLAEQVERTPYFQHHTPTAIQYLHKFLDVEVLSPIH